MRTLLFLMLILPTLASAQVNKSAKELAGENIEAYLQKIYKGQDHTITLGEPKAYLSQGSEAEWKISCRVTFTDVAGKKSSSQDAYSNFMFYLSRRMQVVSAEAYKQN